jgi:hypothetical protein
VKVENKCLTGKHSSCCECSSCWFCSDQIGSEHHFVHKGELIIFVLNWVVYVNCMYVFAC